MTEKETSGRKSGNRRKSPSRSAQRSSSSKRRWPWIVLTVLFVLVGIPALLFGFAYTQYDVPEPEELQPSQISTIVAGDGETQLAKLVPP